MRFIIDYQDKMHLPPVYYIKHEYSFNMDLQVDEIDFDISINMLTLSVVDGKIVRLSGFCGLPKSVQANIHPPRTNRGTLKVENPQIYYDIPGSIGINTEDWPTYKTSDGWICIGNPEGRGETVEFLTRCIAVVGVNGKILSIWIHPIICE